MQIDKTTLRQLADRFNSDSKTSANAGRGHITTLLLELVILVPLMFSHTALWVIILVSLMCLASLFGIAVHMGRDLAFEQCRDVVNRCLPRDGDELMPDPPHSDHVHVRVSGKDVSA